VASLHPELLLAGLLLAAACGAPAKRPVRELPPDEAALRTPTLVRAQRVRLVLSDRWREQARLTAASIDRSDPRSVRATGNARFRLLGLHVEAGGELDVRWLANHENYLLYADQVELFRQERDKPYRTSHLSALAIANDKVSFFQQ